MVRDGDDRLGSLTLLAVQTGSQAASSSLHHRDPTLFSNHIMQTQGFDGAQMGGAFQMLGPDLIWSPRRKTSAWRRARRFI